MPGELPLVVIAGRPNVGKSTLLNRFLGRRDAIVAAEAGVTRDRREVLVDWRGRSFQVVDTGGWLAPRRASSLDEKVSAQAERAIDAAELVLFVVDASVEPTTEDEQVARRLRDARAAVLLVANKVDDEQRERELWRFDRLGMGPAIPVSALHGRASGDLLDAVVEALPSSDSTEATEADDARGPDELAVVIVGRPNVGKSTLFNRLVGDDRSIVHEEAGTTRDAVDTLVETGAGLIRFVDTAGMRRQSRIDEPSEYYGLVRALEAVDRVDVALLVLDATEGPTHQDQRLAERVHAAGTAVVVVLNKWDLLDTQARESVKAQVGRQLAFLDYAPVLTVSAATGRSVGRLLPALAEARDAMATRVPTAVLNRVLARAQLEHPPPMVRGRRPKVLYATQGAADPPTFTLFTTDRLPPTYLRYLERSLREELALGPSPLKLRVRSRSGS